MKLKVITGIVLTLFLIGMLTLTFNIKPVKASGTIYIRADGSIDPPTAPISTMDKVTYTLTDNIFDSIVVERDNIAVDGACYTLKGTGALDSKGMDIRERSNVTIRNTKIEAFWFGIWLEDSSNNSMTGNNITNNMYGIVLYSFSNYNTISGNAITANNDDGVRIYEFSNYNSIFGNNIAANIGFGIWIFDSSIHNSISANNITNNDDGVCICRSSNHTIICGNAVTANNNGVRLSESSNNSIYHNNFINNTQQVSINESYDNVWDDGYPSGGNYWSNYTGVDLYSGPYQNETGSDGIGDTPYIVDRNNTDNYPLMGMFYDFIVIIEYGQVHHVQVISNSTVSNLYVLWWLTSPTKYLSPGQKFIQFYVTGEEGAGFCRVTIPRAVLNDSYVVLVDWNEVPVKELSISNNTHAFLYFTYIHSEHEVIIVPEFPTWTSILLILIVLTVAITINKRRLIKTPIH